jgi:hypothetical protein
VLPKTYANEAGRDVGELPLAQYIGHGP